MPRPLDESQLSLLSPNARPNCDELLSDLKYALNRAANYDIWSKMELCHDSRFPDWPGHNRMTCRKGRSVPGQTPVRPWAGAADLEIRLVDQIIKEEIDICMAAAKRAQPSILPSDLEVDDDQKAQTAELWGGVLEHYREIEEYNIQRAVSELCGIGNEYGHGIMFVGWKEDKRLVRKTIPAELVNQMIATTFINPQMDEEDTFVQMIEMLDPDVLPAEARRAARSLKPGEDCEYAVPVTVRAAPDWRARTPGVNVFYPPETETIQKAQFIVEPEWLSDVEMRGNVVTWQKWSKKNVERVIEETRAGYASFFASLTMGNALGSPLTWQLAGSMVGVGVGIGLSGDQQMRQWQVIRVRYKSIDPKSGISVLYETVFHPDLPDAPLSHTWSVDEHAQYPYIEYKREMSAPTLWASRGIGELSFSEQEEIRGQANMCFDNASLTVLPPFEASPRSKIAVEGLYPGLRVDAISGVANSVNVLKVAGDPTPSINVQEMAYQRAMNYHKLGQSDTMDPVAKQVAQQNVVNGFLLSMREAYRMTFAVIQQFAPDEIRIAFLNGSPVSYKVSREQILGNFTVFCEMEVGDLDMESVTEQLKAVAQFIIPMDNAGLINTQNILKLAMMKVSPSFARQMLKNPQSAQQDEIAEAEANLERNMNGLEANYKTKGGDPALKLQHTQQLINQPAMDEKGKPMLNPETGQPMPGRIARVMQLNPDVAALVGKTMANYQFLLEQQANASTGKTGIVENMQPQNAQ